MVMARVGRGILHYANGIWTASFHFHHGLTKEEETKTERLDLSVESAEN
jgi:hypothetical protein